MQKGVLQILVVTSNVMIHDFWSFIIVKLSLLYFYVCHFSFDGFVYAFIIQICMTLSTVEFTV